MLSLIYTTRDHARFQPLSTIMYLVVAVQFDDAELDGLFFLCRQVQVDWDVPGSWRRGLSCCNLLKSSLSDFTANKVRPRNIQAIVLGPLRVLTNNRCMLHWFHALVA